MKLNFKLLSLLFVFAALNIDAQETKNNVSKYKYSPKKIEASSKENNQDDAIFSKEKLLNWMKNHKKTTALIVASPVIIYGLNKLKKEIIREANAAVPLIYFLAIIEWINNGYRFK